MFNFSIVVNLFQFNSEVVSPFSREIIVDDRDRLQDELVRSNIEHELLLSNRPNALLYSFVYSNIRNARAYFMFEYTKRELSFELIRISRFCYR